MKKHSIYDYICYQLEVMTPDGPLVLPTYGKTLASAIDLARCEAAELTGYEHDASLFTVDLTDKVTE